MRAAEHSDHPASADLEIAPARAEPAPAGGVASHERSIEAGRLVPEAVSAAASHLTATPTLGWSRRGRHPRHWPRKVRRQSFARYLAFARRQRHRSSGRQKQIAHEHVFAARSSVSPRRTQQQHPNSEGCILPHTGIAVSSLRPIGRCKTCVHRHVQTAAPAAQRSRTPRNPCTNRTLPEVKRGREALWPRRHTRTELFADPWT
jgi:hypothetical protein